MRDSVEAEDSVLWDWEVFDEAGRAHSLEDVLDTRLVRDILSFQRKSLPMMRRLLDQIAFDESFVFTAVQPPLELEQNELEPSLEELWKRRLDDDE